MAADGKTPPTHPQGGGAGTLCVHVVSLCADTKTMTCRPCWDTRILTYQKTDRQTHRHTYINQYKHIVIPIHGCICVTYPPFGGGVGGNQGGLDHICSFQRFLHFINPQKYSSKYFQHPSEVTWITKKTPSIESCLVNSDPYKSLSYSPHIWAV